jgi:hypothetical protein
LVLDAVLLLVPLLYMHYILRLFLSFFDLLPGLYYT